MADEPLMPAAPGHAEMPPAGQREDGIYIWSPSLDGVVPDRGVTFVSHDELARRHSEPRTDYGRPRHRDEVLAHKFDDYCDMIGAEAMREVQTPMVDIRPPRTPGQPPPGYHKAVIKPATPPPPATQGPVTAHKPLVLIRPRELQGSPVREREWIVPRWLGTRHVTSCYADGGMGKSSLAQHLLTAAVTGSSFLGEPVTRCGALGLFCEDEPDELHRRQCAINSAMGIDFEDLAGAAWLSGVGEDNLLVVFSRTGVCEPTRRFAELREHALDIGARVVLVDTAADTFGGVENDRAQVRQYIGRVPTGLALDINGAVLLNAHPSRSGLAVGGDLSSGSTAWNNTARSRWTLEEMRSGDDGFDPDVRILTRRKANYSKKGEQIKLRWQNGVLLPPAPATLADAFAEVNRQNDADERFMVLLAQFETEGRPVSVSSNAPNYAPRLFAARAEARGIGKGAFRAAMDRLFAVGRVTNAEYGRAGDRRRKITAEAVN